MSQRDEAPTAAEPQLDLFSPRPPRPAPPLSSPSPPAPVTPVDPPPDAADADVPDEDSALQRAFDEFHAANPHVYEMLVRFARVALAAGRKRIGIGALYERMRWETWVTTTGPEFKLNDHHRSRYARLMMAQEPDLAGVFETRALRS